MVGVRSGNGDHRVSGWHLFGLAMIVILAAILRIAGIGRESMSGDELGSLEVAAGRGQIHLVIPRGVALRAPPAATTLDGAPAVWHVPLGMGADVHPPLYFICLRLWEDIFGDGDVACRAMSATAGVLGVVLIFDIGRWLASASAGLWAALLMALAQPQIIYSQDARPYALVIFFTLLAADGLIRIVRLGPSAARSIAMGSGALAASLTHYFVLPAFLAMGVYSIVRLGDQPRRRVLLAFLIAGALSLLLWGRQAWDQRANFTDPWMYWFYGKEPHHVAVTIGRLAELPMRYLLEPPNTTNAPWLAAVIYGFPFLQCRKNRDLLLPGFWLLGCAALLGGLDLVRSTNLLDSIKYTLVAGPAVYLILPTILNGRGAWIVPLAGAIACVLVFPQTYETVKSDFRGAAMNVARSVPPGGTLVISGGGWGSWYGGLLYLAVEHYSRPMPTAVAILTAPATAELDAELRKGGRRCWLLTSWTGQPASFFMPGWKPKDVGAQPGTYKFYQLTQPDKP
jgi:Dolichyl-phosphate-mannose-protein mannosyltransferase